MQLLPCSGRREAEVEIKRVSVYRIPAGLAGAEAAAASEAAAHGGRRAVPWPMAARSKGSGSRGAPVGDVGLPPRVH